VSDDFSLTVRREIAASAEDLFDAWLDPESMSAWMKPRDIRETHAENDPREGGSFRIVMVRDDDDSVVHTGMYRVIDRPRRSGRVGRVGRVDGGADPSRRAPECRRAGRAHRWLDQCPRSARTDHAVTVPPTQE
jgi:hypothetical protein